MAVLCITKSGEVINYQAFTNSRGIYSVAETMPESDRWESCLARPISSFSDHCTNRGDKHSGVKFSYKLPSGQTHNVRPFLYKPTSAPVYCSWIWSCPERIWFGWRFVDRRSLCRVTKLSLGYCSYIFYNFSLELNQWGKVYGGWILWLSCSWRNI